MSHTTILTDDEAKEWVLTTILTDDEGREWVLIHNGDWSGDVEIHQASDKQELAEEEIFRLPGSVIRQACARAVLDDMIAMFEKWAKKSKDSKKPRRSLKP
jgi:hypothetical protein